MSGAASEDPPRFVVGYRYASGQIPRATQRVTAVWQAHPRLSLGLEVQAETGQLGPLVNALLLEEGPSRPAVMAGTSSDRIGTRSGQAYYVTLSKDLEAWTGLPVAPYVGASYGTYAHVLRPVAGLSARLPHDFGALVLFDGVHVHPTVDWTWKRFVFGLLLVECKDPGVSISVAF